MIGDFTMDNVQLTINNVQLTMNNSTIKKFND